MGAPRGIRPQRDGIGQTGGAGGRLGDVEPFSHRRSALIHTDAVAERVAEGSIEEHSGGERVRPGSVSWTGLERAASQGYDGNRPSTGHVCPRNVVK